MSRVGRLRVSILIGCLLTVVANCSFSKLSTEKPQNSEVPNEQKATSSGNDLTPGQPGVNIDFALTNFTGATLVGIYVSPATSSGWEENILGGTALKHGETVSVQFNPNEKATEWDIRIEGEDGHFAEWKNFHLGDFREIRLVLKLSPERLVVAEVDR